MNTDERVMRCRIAGSWTAKDMAESLMAFRDLYNIRLGLEVFAEDQRDLEQYLIEFMHFPPLRKRLKSRRLHPLFLQALFTGPSAPIGDIANVARLVYPHEELKVRKIKYASPGFKDLAGFGEIIGHIKDFILKLVDHFGSKRSRHLKDEEHELRNQSIRIQNARDFVGLARECGFDESEIRQLINSVDDKQDPIVRLVQSGKIQNVLMLDESNEDDGLDDDDFDDEEFDDEA